MGFNNKRFPRINFLIKPNRNFIKNWLCQLVNGVSRTNLVKSHRAHRVPCSHTSVVAVHFFEITVGRGFVNPVENGFRKEIVCTVFLNDRLCQYFMNPLLCQPGRTGLIEQERRMKIDLVACRVQIVIKEIFQFFYK